MPFVDVGGTEIYYEQHGGGHPIICCHGDGRDHRSWMPQVEELADEFEVITYDLNGYGQSGGSTRNEQSYSTHTEDLRALIEELDIDDPTIVGWSMGGRVAYTYAARYPDNLSALVLLEPATRNFDEPPLVAKPLHYILPTLGKVVGWPRLLDIRRSVMNLRGNNDSGEEESIQGLGMTKSEYFADVESQIDSAEYSKMMVSMRDEMLHSDTPAVDFASVSVPVLALTGDDPSEPFTNTLSALAEEAETIRRETIPDAGHSAQIDNPDDFNRLLREFLIEQMDSTSSDVATPP